MRIAGYPETASAVVESASACDEAVRSGRVAITNHAEAVSRCDAIDVVVDATGRPAVGAEIGLGAMEHGKHLVMMNVEADVTIGAYLQREARRLGVVYTLGAGDEPSACMELINFVTSLGYPITTVARESYDPRFHELLYKRLRTARKVEVIYRGDSRAADISATFGPR